MRPVAERINEELSVVYVPEKALQFDNVFAGVGLEQIKEDIFLPIEVGVKSAFAEPRLLGDAFNGRAFVAVACNNFARGRKQLCFRPRLALLACQSRPL